MAKLGESVEKVEDGRFRLALGAIEGGVDDFLAQELPQVLNQVQAGRIRGQKDLHEAFIHQPSRENLVIVVAGVVADDVNRPLRVGGEQLLVQPRGALRVDTAGFVQVHLGGAVGVEGRVEVDLLAATDGE